MLAWVPVLGFTRNAGKAGESDPGPHLEEAPGGWESQRGIGCLPGHRVGFITASDGDSSRLKASSSLTRLLTSDMLLRLSAPHLPQKQNEDSVGGSSCGRQEHSASGYRVNTRLGRPNLGCSDPFPRAVNEGTRSIMTWSDPRSS